jgi:hypothetical protein
VYSSRVWRWKTSPDNQKRYRFTLRLGNSRMLCALSVVALCCFGAENLQVVRKSYSLGVGLEHWAVASAPHELFCTVLVRLAAPVHATPA